MTHRNVLVLAFLVVVSVSCSPAPSPGAGDVDPPIIVSFTASPSAIDVGGSSQLTWQVEGDGDISLDIAPGVGAVTGTRVQVEPAETTTYTLTAKNQGGSTTARANVRVGEVRVSLSPSKTTLAQGQSQEFTASVSGVSDKGVAWEASGGTIAGTGPTILYTAPSEPGSFTITATSQADLSQSATATMTVRAVGISITPARVELDPGGTQEFTAEVVGATDTTVLWSVDGGSISGSGPVVVYQAPDEPGEYAVTATSNSDPSATAEATVVVIAPQEPEPNQAPEASFGLTPQSGFQPLTVQLDASESHDLDGEIAAYRWDFGDGSTGEGVTAEHVYEEAGSYTITLTVEDDDGETASAEREVQVDARIDLTLPGGRYSLPVDLNDAGQAAGYSEVLVGERCTAHGFLWDGAKLVDLVGLGGPSLTSVARDINAHGVAVGESTDSNGRMRATLWDGDQVVDLGVLGGSWSDAAGINDDGLVVGVSSFSDETATYYRPSHDFLWDGSQMHDLTPGMNEGGPVLLSEGGQAFARGTKHTIVGTAVYRTEYGFYWNGSEVHAIPGLADLELLTAVDINRSGQAVGYFARDGTNYAFLYDGGGLVDLGSLGGGWSRAEAVNDAGQVVGSSTTADGAAHAFLWSDGVMTDLGTLGGESSLAYDINNAGQIVGRAKTASGEVHAVIWDDGGIRDLGTVGMDMAAAYFITESGLVAGTAQITEDGRTRRQLAFLWDGEEIHELPPLAGSDSSLVLNHSFHDVDGSDVGQALGESSGEWPRATLWVVGTGGSPGLASDGLKPGRIEAAADGDTIDCEDIESPGATAASMGAWRDSRR